MVNILVHRLNQRCIAFVVALISSTIFQNSVDPPKKRHGQAVHAQAQTNNTKRSLAIDYGAYSVTPPPGRGWQATTDARKTFGSLVEFDNAELKAFASVDESLSPQPVIDVHARLLALSDNLRKTLESQAKVIRFESAIRMVGGRECLFATAIVNPRQAIAGLSPKVNQVWHTCSCIYRNAKDQSDHLVGLNYGNAAVGDADPQKEQAEAFFAGLQFKELPFR